jgi:hypothetical protein
MVDLVVLLTPLLVLSVVALLGFAGCSFEARVGPDLALLARVPTGLTVTEVVFRWTPPEGPVSQQVLTNPTPLTTEGPDNVYRHGLYDPPVGRWLTSCRVTVQDATGSAVDGDQGDFNLQDPDSFLQATYQASGSPSGGNFAVSFAGAVETVSA